MKTLSLHIPSVLVGLGLAALIGIAMGQNPVNSPALDVRVVEPAQVLTPVHPRDYVTISEGVPYTIPSDRWLLLSSVWGGQNGLRVLVDGNPVIDTFERSHPFPPYDLPPSLVADPGSTVELIVQDGDGNKRLSGYLVDA